MRSRYLAISRIADASRDPAKDAGRLLGETRTNDFIFIHRASTFAVFTCELRPGPGEAEGQKKKEKKKKRSRETRDGN